MGFFAILPFMSFFSKDEQLQHSNHQNWYLKGFWATLSDLIASMERPAARLCLLLEVALVSRGDLWSLWSTSCAAQSGARKTLFAKKSPAWLAACRLKRILLSNTNTQIQIQKQLHKYESRLGCLLNAYKLKHILLLILKTTSSATIWQLQNHRLSQRFGKTHHILRQVFRMAKGCRNVRRTPYVWNRVDRNKIDRT